MAERAATGRIPALIRALLVELGEDPAREGLVHTPEAAAGVLRPFGAAARRVQPAPSLSPAAASTPVASASPLSPSSTSAGASAQMQIVYDLEFVSLCEHHLLPFFGSCHVGWVQGERPLPLPFLSQLLGHFATRLQLQERLTEQLANALETAVQPGALAIVIQGRHMCMRMRGVEKQNTVIESSALRGRFLHDVELRRSFYTQLRRR